MQRTDTSDGSSIRMTYNDIGLPTGQHYTVAGAGSRNVYYTYAEADNLPKKTSFGSGSDYSAENTYDGLGRLDYVKYETPSDSVGTIKADYNYLDVESEENRTTDIVNNIKYTYTTGQLDAPESFYAYGAAGNITSEYVGSDATGELKEKYGYDDKGQLVHHYSARQNKTFVYEYNDAGNITAKKVYPYVSTLSALNAIIDSPDDTISYEYSNGVWGDLLEKYDGKSITSDNIGNITSWDGKTFTWKGRQLASYKKNNVTTSYQYNADGIRTRKQSGNVTTEYFLNGSQILMQQTKEGETVTETMWFFYDNQGNRIGLCRDGDYFYYLYNVQGDVLALVDAATGKIAANYQYGAWGEATSIKTAEGFGDLGEANPFRYRGYYWDTESGLYYLNSRYYSPELCRFISADSQINGDILGTNLFAYCSNNPVNRTDDQGTFWDTLLDVGCALYSAWQVVTNPSPENWLALGADVACIVVPFATGGGAAVRGTVKYADDALAAAAKGSNAADAGKMLNSAGNDTLRMADVRQKGRIGEELSGIVKNTAHIPSMTGTAKYRIPDGLSYTTLSEVKNYKGTLSYTSQLKDFVLYSQNNKLEMHLYTNAKLSGPLQALVDSDIIKVFPLD